MGYTPGVLTAATADMTVTLLLATSRRLLEGAFWSNMIAWILLLKMLILIGCRLGKYLGYSTRTRAMNMDIIHGQWKCPMYMDITYIIKN